MLRAALLLILCVSVSISGWNVLRLSQNPALSALTQRTGAELTATLNREIAKAATPRTINSRLKELLSETPTPWLAIRAVEDVAAFRNITLDPEIKSAITRKYDDEHGLLLTSGKCISCGWDASNCELSAILLCRAPVDLTPVGDIAGVIRESGNYVLGNEVDKIDLTLSAVGLGATVIAPATGGTSLAVKLGASTLKTAKKLGNLSPGLARTLTTSADRAIDWKTLSNANPLDFRKAVKEAVNPQALTPVTDILKASADIRGNTGVIETLHLMRYMENAEDAVSTARISGSLGPRTISAFELVGKSRLIRATIRYSDEAMGAIFATISAFLSLIGLLLGSVTTKATRMALRKSG